MGRGREPWERSEAGGVNDDERHLHHSSVSSPTEELRKDKRRSDDIAKRERTRPGLYFVFCVRQSSVRGCRFTFVFIYFIKLAWMFAGSRLLLLSFRSSSVGLETGEWCRCIIIIKLHRPRSAPTALGPAPLITASKHIYNITIFTFQINAVLLNFLFIKESRKKMSYS